MHLVQSGPGAERGAFEDKPGELGEREGGDDATVDPHMVGKRLASERINRFAPKECRPRQSAPLPSGRSPHAACPSASATRTATAYAVRTPEQPSCPMRPSNALSFLRKEPHEHRDVAPPARRRQSAKTPHDAVVHNARTARTDEVNVLGYTKCSACRAPLQSHRSTARSRTTTSESAKPPHRLVAESVALS